MNDDKPPIPEDHPIREIWETGRKRATLPGLIELAESGDKGAARDLLALFVFRQGTPDDLGRQRIHQQELLDYLARCFNDILKSGCNPELAGKALHLTTGENKRPKLSFREREAKARIGWKVADCMRTKGLTLEDATAEIGSQENVSQGKAKESYLKYMVVKASRSRSKK